MKKDRILIVSDKVSSLLYSPSTQKDLQDVRFIISSGDLPYEYLEYLVSIFNVPLYFVRGNHARCYETESGVIHQHPWGSIDLHLHSIKNEMGYLLAGVQGSHLYNNGAYQYSQATMWRYVFQLVPSLMANFVLSGRYLDIFVTHAPPWGIHDNNDIPHQGIKAFLWVLKVFKPRYHFHGHVYDFTKKAPMITQFGSTTIINTYGYRLQEMSVNENISEPDK